MPLTTVISMWPRVYPDLQERFLLTKGFLKVTMYLPHAVVLNLRPLVLLQLCTSNENIKNVVRCRDSSYNGKS